MSNVTAYVYLQVEIYIYMVNLDPRCGSLSDRRQVRVYQSIVLIIVNDVFNAFNHGLLRRDLAQHSRTGSSDVSIPLHTSHPPL